MSMRRVPRTPLAKEAWAKALAGQVPTIEKETPTLQNAALLQQMDHEVTVDAATDGGHFARWGEPARANLGPDAGEHLGTRHMGA